MIGDYSKFFKYLSIYPASFEDGYDGIHDGGIKGIKKSAPQEAKDLFKLYVKSTHKDNYPNPIEYQEVD